MDLNSVLSVSRLEKAFTSGTRGNTVKALDNVSFDLARGSCMAIVGESGSGKTTLARCIAGLLVPDAGAIRIACPERSSTNAVQMVFQEVGASLNPRRTVRESLKEAVSQGDHVGIATVCARVGFDEELLDRFPHQLSGGQRQRIGLARALAVSPAILVLDEPLTALDDDSREKVLDLLKKEQNDLGLSIVIISHDLTLVAGVAETVQVMLEGRIVESGLISEVFAAPTHPYTRTLLDASTTRIAPRTTRESPGEL